MTAAAGEGAADKFAGRRIAGREEPSTLVAQLSSTIRKPPVPRTVPSRRSVIGKRCVKGSTPVRSSGRKKFGCARASPPWSRHRRLIQLRVDRALEQPRAITERPPLDWAPGIGLPSTSVNVAQS